MSRKIQSGECFAEVHSRFKKSSASSAVDEIMMFSEKLVRVMSLRLTSTSISLSSMIKVFRKVNFESPIIIIARQIYEEFLSYDSDFRGERKTVKAQAFWIYIIYSPECLR